MAFAQHAAAVGFVVGDGNYETGDTVGVAVEGNDFDEGRGVVAIGEVGGVFWKRDEFSHRGWVCRRGWFVVGIEEVIS